MQTQASGWAGKYKSGVNTRWGPGQVNTRWGPGPVNTNWEPGPVNTNWGPGPVNTNWGPGPGARARAGGQAKGRGREIQRPSFSSYFQLQEQIRHFCDFIINTVEKIMIFWNISQNSIKHTWICNLLGFNTVVLCEKVIHHRCFPEDFEKFLGSR